MIIHRFTSLVMGLRDGNDRFGEFLELIPEESIGVSAEDTFFARE